MPRNHTDLTIISALSPRKVQCGGTLSAIPGPTIWCLGLVRIFQKVEASLLLRHGDTSGAIALAFQAGFSVTAQVTVSWKLADNHFDYDNIYRHPLVQPFPLFLSARPTCIAHTTPLIRLTLPGRHRLQTPQFCHLSSADRHYPRWTGAPLPPPPPW